MSTAVAALGLSGGRARFVAEGGDSLSDAIMIGSAGPRRVGALLLGASYQLPAGCPVDESSCVFSCIKDGFSAEVCSRSAQPRPSSACLPARSENVWLRVFACPFPSGVAVCQRERVCVSLPIWCCLL